MALIELSKENIKDIYTLSPMQEGIFFHWLYDETSQAYFEQMSYRLSANLDAALVRKSLQELFKRYDVLRTVFIRKEANRILQVVLKERAVDFYWENISGREDKEEYIKKYKENDRKKLFNLGKDVLMRVALLQSGDNEFEFTWSFHHIIMDGWCLGILISDFREIYRGLAENKPWNLPPVKPYRDYIQWLEQQDKEKARIYWRNYLAGYEEQVGIPRLKGFPPGGGDYKMTAVLLALEEADTSSLVRFSAANRVTLNTIIQAVWGILLGTYNGKRDVVFGSVVSGRPPDIDGAASMVGLFINTIPVRIYFDGRRTFCQLLGQVRQAAVESEPFHYYPLVEIQVESGPKQHLLDHVMEFQNYPVTEQLNRGSDNPRSLSLKVIGADVFEQTNYAFNVRITPGMRLEVSLECDEREYEREFVKKIAANFRYLLQQVPGSGDVPVQDLELPTGEEKRQILYDFNNTAAEYPIELTLHEFFRQAVGKGPDRIAAIFGREQVTYNELNNDSGALAVVLRGRGVTVGKVAAVMAVRSLEMLTGIMGVLKSGAAYLPIDPGFPAERITYMLKESCAHLVLTTGEVPGVGFGGEELNRLDLKQRQLYTNNRGAEGGSVGVTGMDPAYVIYTSGSTGRPKGVIVEHRNVVNLNKGITAIIDFSPGKAMLALTTISFDIFVLETILPLLNNLKVVIAGERRQKDPGLLGNAIVENGVEMAQMTPSTLQMLFTNDPPLCCLERVKELMVGGEAFPAHLFGNLRGVYGGKIYNMYGPTETTVWSAVKDLTGAENVNLGRGIANTSIYIIDSQNRIQPVGAAGELCIGGDGVARGYLNRPELSSEKFNKSFSGGAGGRFFKKAPLLYRTGDLARWLPDGNIQFSGRIDRQVKVRGFRIELGEIESRLLDREDIKEAIAVIKEDNGADKYICAYIVPVPGSILNETKLREYLAGTLPYYMLPSYIIQLEHIPLTPNGKIHVNALPAPVIKEREAGATPRSDLEERLAGIWSGVLGIAREKLGIDDNFFQVGGHSLKAVIMTSGIHKEFNVTISLVEFFKRPTIRQLSEYIKKAELDRFFAVEPAEKREYYPLSSAQERLFFLQQMEEFSTAYNMTAVMEWRGVVDRDRLERTFRRLTERHESFRTSFHMVDGRAVQRIHSPVKFEIQYNDKVSVDKDLRNFIKPFDLGQVPLLKAGLFEMSPGRNLLMVDMHHIISDGVSVQLAVRDFVRFYAGEDLPPLRLQYKDYSQWQCGQRQKEILKKQRAYWIGKFAGEVPVLQLPLDYPRPVLQSFEGETVHFQLNEEETRGLRAVAQAVQGTLYMVLLGLYTVFLMKISGQEDIVVGTPAAGRRHKDLEQIIGNFVNTLALRNRLDGGMSFSTLLGKVKENLLQAFDNQEYPYEDLIEEAGIKRDTGRNPLFDAALAFHNVDVTGEIPRVSIPDVMIKPLPLAGKTSKFDLTLQVMEEGEKIALDFEYCGKLFKPCTIRRFVEYFKEILKVVPQEPAILLREISIISPGARQELLTAFNQTRAGYPGHQVIHRLFEEQAARTPDALSVTYEDKALTYRELNGGADCVAHYLISRCGLKTGDPVALLVNRSENVIIGMLGILKAGGAYLPIDPDYPQERIDYMLEDSGVKLLVTASEKESEKVRRWEGKKVLLESIIYDSDHLKGGPRRGLHHSNQLAYIIYTSGSTGKPKGVMIEHRNVVRLFFHEGCLFDFSGGDIWTMFHSPCFDFSVWEMYGALLFGGKVIVVSKIAAREPARFLELLELGAVTILNQTPSAFYALEAVELQRVDKKLNLRVIIFGGEALHPIKLEKWREKYPGTRLINMFGITETTVHVTYRRLSEEDIRRDLRHIGLPIPTLSAYVVDRYRQLLPTGIVGELCVGGAGVARGYMNRVELTAQRFIENPYEPGGRLYRSGDLVKITGGDMEYLGRGDHQVQIRGFRVELGEIENRLLQHPQITDAYVMDGEDSAGDVYLCAYIVVEKENGPDTAGLRQYLASRLPEYMIPSFFVCLGALPVTANGKVDRRALPAPLPGEPGKNFTAPRDEMEKKLVELWAAVLGLDREMIGIDDNFFELGGHSLKAGTLAAAVHKEMDVKLPLPEIFITPHIRGLAQYIGKAVKDKYRSIEPAKKKDYYALSSAQRRLYIMQHVDPTITAYNITPMYSVRGPLDKEKLETAFRRLIQVHESLRTSFKTFAGEPVQEIHEKVQLEIEYYNANAGESTAMDNFVRPFDLRHAPLLRVGLVKVKEEEHILMIDMHHIITDGVSAKILVRDFAALYGGKPLPQLKLQYKDFSEWQNSEPVKKDMARQKTYWLNRFAGPIPRLNLATDYERSQVKTFAGGSIDFVIGKELNLRVKKLIQETGTSIFMFLLAVYNVLLFRYGNQEDILVGSPITGRRHSDLRHIVGMFVNMLVYRNHPAGDKTFRKFLEEVKQNALLAYENQDYQFEHLIVDLNLQGTADRNPLFDVVFSMQKIDLDKGENVDEDYFKGIEHLQINPYPFKKQTTPFELLMSAYETNDAIMMTLDYAVQLFKPSTAEKICRHYVEVIGQVVEDINIELKNVRLSHQFKQIEDVHLLEDREDFGF